MFNTQIDRLNKFLKFLHNYSIVKLKRHRTGILFLGRIVIKMMGIS